MECTIACVIEARRLDVMLIDKKNQKMFIFDAAILEIFMSETKKLKRY